MAQAARRLGVARQGVQRIAHDLVQEDLAVFRSNPDHRSSPLPALTPGGHGVLGRITDRASEIHRVVAADIPASDIAAARDLLHRLIDAVRRHQEG